MTSWRYIAQRITGDGAGGAILDWEVPLQGAEITDTLSGPNGLQGSISPVYSRLLGADGRPILQEWGTAIWAEADGDIRGGGILVDSGFRGPEWSIDCMGLAGYATGMPYTDSNFWVETDVLDIVRAIWDHLQSKPGGNLGLELSNAMSGVKIGTTRAVASFDPGDNPDTGPTEFESGVYRLAWYQDHDLGSSIDDLAKETPFDYHERHFWDGETIRHKLDFGYPRLGDRRENLRFEIGVNVGVPDINPAGEEYADEVLFLGAGEGRTRKVGYASRRDDRLRRVTVVEDVSVRKLDQADRHAKRELAKRIGELDITDLIVLDHPNAPPGSFVVGDEIFVEGDVDWIEDVGVWLRILSIRHTPESGTAATLSVARSDKIFA